MNQNYIVNENQLQKILEQIVPAKTNVKKIKEQEEPNLTPDFYKNVYNPEDKSITGAYTIYDETDKMVEVLNIQELKSDKGLYMDGAEPYNIKINKVKLPKSQIEIIGPVEGKDNFVYIKIPYWLFKKQTNELTTKKLNGLKKINFTPYQYKDNEFLSMLNDSKIIDHLTTSNPDSTTKSWVNSVGRRYNPEE